MNERANTASHHRRAKRKRFFIAAIEHVLRRCELVCPCYNTFLATALEAWRCYRGDISGACHTRISAPGEKRKRMARRRTGYGYRIPPKSAVSRSAANDRPPERSALLGNCSFFIKTRSLPVFPTSLPDRCSLFLLVFFNQK